jgi:hypothetical protein
MIGRVLEPEAMDTAEEAHEYDLMDHRAVNARFVTDVLDYMVRLGPSDLRGLFVVDVGTGTARIPIEFCRAQPAGRRPSILRARCCVRRQRECVVWGLTTRLALQLARVTALPFREACSPVVMRRTA